MIAFPKVETCSQQQKRATIQVITGGLYFLSTVEGVVK